ncbi:MAG: four helix bundle protein [Bacteroidota bacterium]|jgi:four helix bundle protein
MFRFENLEIWKRSIEITDKMFDLADRLEEMKRFRFAEQLRGTALSITNNISEGSGSSSRREFRQFLNYSHRSVFETANILIVCHRRKYIGDKERDDQLQQLEEISKMVTGFSKSL